MESFLTIQEIKILKEGHRASRNKKQADRIKTILLLDQGYKYDTIAKLLLLDDSTLRSYYKQYQQGGLDELGEDHYATRQAAKLTEEQEEELKKHLDKKMYAKVKKVCEYVELKYEVKFTVSGMTAVLHKLGFVYKKTKNTPGKADKDKQIEFIKEYQAIKKDKKPEDVIYFVDASHPQHNSMPSYGWILKGKTKELKSNTGRKRINLHGALNLEKLEVEIREDESINYESTLKLFHQLEVKHPDGEIHVIIDNASYYKKKDVQEYAENSRIRLHFLPAYAPNLNTIERLWQLMHEEVLYNKYYSSYLEFKVSVMKFFENFDEYSEVARSRLTDNFEIIPSWNSDSCLR
jgi:transposase